MTSTARTEKFDGPDGNEPRYKEVGFTSVSAGAALSVAFGGFSADQVSMDVGAGSDDSEYQLGTRKQQSVFESLADHLDQQANVLAKLPPNWDGYGADPIPEQTIRLILGDLRTALQGIACPAPDLIPGADGSVQAEWHQRNVQITYNRDADGNRYVWMRRRRSGWEREAFQLEALSVLKKSVRDLVD